MPDTSEGAPAAWTRDSFETTTPLTTLREQVQAVRVVHLDPLPPFIGGAVGYAGYDAVRYVEHLPNPPNDDRELPDLMFAFYDHMVVFDHVQKTIIVLALADVRDQPCPTLHEPLCDVPMTRPASAWTR